MGSKKDEKYRFVMLDVGINIDLKDMCVYGTEKF